MHKSLNLKHSNLVVIPVCSVEGGLEGGPKNEFIVFLGEKSSECSDSRVRWMGKLIH